MTFIKATDFTAERAWGVLDIDHKKAPAGGAFLLGRSLFLRGYTVLNRYALAS